MLEQQRDEQAADSTVASEVGVDGLELHVQEPRTNERRQVFVRGNEVVPLILPSNDFITSAKR